jgi:serine/threonine protein kinase/tetratricopeptide (TPR) repeat protein
MSDELIGGHLGSYLVESKLGQGGMGVVYRAVDEKLRRTVALKVLPPAFTGDADRRRRFEREARAAAAVTHACIATVYEVGESEGRVFIAMELVEGSSLASRIAGAPLPLAAALRIARDVARGLAKAHERSVVHRDLKPDNVMITDEGEVKILDFGLARRDEPAAVGHDQDVTAAAMTMPGQIMGTPGYMSPEQAAGKPTDARTDLFSLGVVLYEMVTGARPFRGDAAMDVIIALCRDEPEAPSALNPAVTPEVERVIARCMAKRPDDRYVGARELLAELDALDPATAASRSLVSSPGGPSSTTGPISAPPLAPTTSSPHTSTTLPATAAGPARPRVQKRAVFAALGLVAFGAVGALALREPATRRRGPRPAVPQARASWGRRPITADPPPSSASAEALRRYVEGLRASRDGAQELALERFTLASTLDPDLAAAHLRIALARGVERGREALLQALSHRGLLDERDRAVLDAVAPAYTETPTDFTAASARLAAVAQRFPDDVTVLSALGRVQAEHDLRASVASQRRVSALDPGHVPARSSLADSLTYLGDLPGARRTLEECLEVSPSATACLRQQVYLELAVSDCAAVETTARRWMLISREGGSAQRFLAYGLAGQGRPLDAMRETLVQSRASQVIERRAQSEQEDARALAALAGDFAEAARRGAAVEALVEASRAESDHAAAAAALAMILDEQGRGADAARVAQRFLERREAWEVTPRTDDRALGRDPTQALLSVQVRAGTLAAPAAAAQRAARRAWWERRQGALPEVGGFVWITQYAAGVETQAEAAEALAALARFEGVPPFALMPGMHMDAVVGRAYLLAGRAAEALPALTRAATSCYALRFPVDQMRAVRDLGVARAATGDRAGACAAWRQVVDRWGSATPRSVTADDARARMRANSCG